MEIAFEIALEIALKIALEIALKIALDKKLPWSSQSWIFLNLVFNHFSQKS